MNAVNTTWLETVIASQHDSGLVSPLGDVLPGFPSETLQRNTTGLSGEAGLSQAFAFYEDVVDGLTREGRVLDHEWSILDFGTGWGRIVRFFLERVPASQIHGIDVDSEFIGLTKELFQGGDFRVCDPFPPTSFGDNSLDLVSAYSVFSHLSEPSARAWMHEFYRILKPRGYVAFTTRDPSFFAYLDWARAQGDAVEGYTKALGTLFNDTVVARALYQAGQFVHGTSQGVSGGGPRNETFYGESFIPEAFVVRELGSLFDVRTNGFDSGRYDQRFFLLQKK